MCAFWEGTTPKLNLSECSLILILSILWGDLPASPMGAPLMAWMAAHLQGITHSFPKKMAPPRHDGWELRTWDLRPCWKVYRGEPQRYGTTLVVPKFGFKMLIPQDLKAETSKSSKFQTHVGIPWCQICRQEFIECPIMLQQYLPRQWPDPLIIGGVPLWGG